MESRTKPATRQRSGRPSPVRAINVPKRTMRGLGPEDDPSEKVTVPLPRPVAPPTRTESPRTSNLHFLDDTKITVPMSRQTLAQKRDEMRPHAEVSPTAALVGERATHAQPSIIDAPFKPTMRLPNMAAPVEKQTLNIEHFGTSFWQQNTVKLPTPRDSQRASETWLTPRSRPWIASLVVAITAAVIIAGVALLR